MRAEPTGVNVESPIRKISEQIKEKSQIEIDSSIDKIEITKKDAELEIDNYPSRFDLGYKNFRDRGQEFTQESQQKALKGIQKYARQGDQLMDFQNFNVADLAKAEMETELPEITLKYVRMPEISATGASLDVSI
ncbi:MAG: DUF6470 family protein [Halanaerobiaceae bacterium]